jgi:hypothetical protein
VQLDAGNLGVFELYNVYVFDVYVPAILGHSLFNPQTPYHMSFVEV